MNVLWRLVDEVAAAAASCREFSTHPDGCTFDAAGIARAEELEKAVKLARHALEALGVPR